MPVSGAIAFDVSLAYRHSRYVWIGISARRGVQHASTQTVRHGCSRRQKRCRSEESRTVSAGAFALPHGAQPRGRAPCGLRRDPWPAPSGRGANRHLRAHGCGAHRDPWQNLRRHRLRRCHQCPSRRHHRHAAAEQQGHHRPRSGGFRRADRVGASNSVHQLSVHASRRGVRRADRADGAAAGRQLSGDASRRGVATS